MVEPVKVVITGGSGSVAYNLSCLIAHGSTFGEKQPVIINLYDVSAAKAQLVGVANELGDCVLQALERVIPTTDITKAFKEVDVAIMLGSIDVKEGMEKKDILESTLNLFRYYGEALEMYAKKSVRVIVSAYPMNINTLILSKFAPSIPKNNFTSVLRLEHNRAKVKIANRLKISCGDVRNVIMWGNHGQTVFANLSHAYILENGKEVTVPVALDNEDWTKNEFLESIQNRSENFRLEISKQSGAAAVARAIVDHLHDIWFGTPEGIWTSMGVYSRGEYGAPNDVIFGFPVTIKNKEHAIVANLDFDDWADVKFEKTAKELESERETILTAIELSRV